MKDGGAAFPTPHRTIERDGIYEPAEQGMTLRDWFAGQALVGCLANNLDPSVAIKTAWLTADAMLAERDAER